MFITVLLYFTGSIVNNRESVIFGTWGEGGEGGGGLKILKYENIFCDQLFSKSWKDKTNGVMMCDGYDMLILYVLLFNFNLLLFWAALT